MDEWQKSTLAKVWRWYANCAGIGLLALLISFGLVEMFAGDGPVLKRVGDIDSQTTVTHVGGSVSYNIDVNRLESCPGTPVIAFRSHHDNGNVVVRIPTSPISPDSLYPGIRPTAHVTLAPLPAEIGPGTWTYDSGVESRCPTRTRYDPLAKFDFKVIP